MTEDETGHAPSVRVIETPTIVHVRVNVVVDGRLRGRWQHVEGAYTLHPCTCHGEGVVEPEALDPPCPQQHDPIFRYRNVAGRLCCRQCARDQNREYARQRRAKAA
jgi:hypothetical protein